MTKKKLLIVVVAGLLSTVLLLFGVGIRLGLIQQFAAFSVPCEVLSEDHCIDRADCRANYGASCPGCMNIQYKGCALISTDDQAKITADKLTCAQTDGQWINDRFADPGSCLCPNPSFFVAPEGCRSMEMDCQLLGGKLYPEGTLRCTSEMYQNPLSACNKKVGYNQHQVCLCPDGSEWSTNRRCDAASR